MYNWDESIRRTTISGSIGLGQMRMRIPSKMKNECQIVKVIVSDTWID